MYDYLVVMDPSDTVEVWDCPYVLISEIVRMGHANGSKHSGFKRILNMYSYPAPTSGKESGSGHWKLSVTGTMFVSICKAVDSSRRKLSSSSTWEWCASENKSLTKNRLQALKMLAYFKSHLCLTRSNALGGRIRMKWRMSCNWRKKMR